MPALVQDTRRWAIAAAAAAIAIAAGGRPAAAQKVIYQADGAVNVGYTQTTQAAFLADPMAEPGDVPEDSVGRFFTEIRPGVSVSSGSPRLTWRAGYQFSSNFSFDGAQDPAYSNTADASLVAATTKYTLLTLNASLTQGGTAFILSQKAADAGNPEIRAPGNPNVLAATLGESFSWEAGKALALQHTATATMSAPQDDLGSYNGALTATLALDRVWKRDRGGLEIRASASRLQPLEANATSYMSYTNGIVARWTRDFSYEWNVAATAGIEQVFSDTGSQPLAFVPAGTATAIYTHGQRAGAIELSHGAVTNIQVGTVSITDRITARGIYTLNAEQLRVLNFSAGFLHNEPLGEAESLAAAGTGNAIAGDAGFTTALNKRILLTARYSLAYQFGQSGGLAPTLAHIALVGVTARYSNSDKPARPRASRGRRVDKSDAFPLEDVKQP